VRANYCESGGAAPLAEVISIRLNWRIGTLRHDTGSGSTIDRATGGAALSVAGVAPSVTILLLLNFNHIKLELQELSKFRH